MSDTKQSLFLLYLSNVIAENPEWYAEAVLAMQGGLSGALLKERREKADVCAALGWMMTQAPKVFDKEKARMQSGIQVLCESYATSALEEVIRKYIVTDNEQ